MRRRLSALADDLVNNTVIPSLIGCHDVVAFGVFLDLFDLLPGVCRQDFVQFGACSYDFTSMDVDIACLAGQAAHQRLVDDDP